EDAEVLGGVPGLLAEQHRGGGDDGQRGQARAPRGDGTGAAGQREQRDRHGHGEGGVPFGRRVGGGAQGQIGHGDRAGGREHRERVTAARHEQGAGEGTEQRRVGRQRALPETGAGVGRLRRGDGGDEE